MPLPPDINFFDDDEEGGGGNIISWKKLRKKREQDFLLRDYVRDIQRLENLSKDATIALWTQININLRLQIIVAEDIIIVDGKISRIENFDYTTGKVIGKKHILPPKSSSKSTCTSMAKLWEQWLINTSKKHNKTIILPKESMLGDDF